MWSLISFPRAIAVTASAAVTLIFVGGSRPLASRARQSNPSQLLPIRLISGGEYAARTSYYVTSSNQIGSTTDHCVELVWRYTNGPETTPFGSSGGGGSSSISGSSLATSPGLTVSQPIGVPVAGTTGSTGSTGSSGCGGYQYTQSTTYNYVYVDGSSIGGPVAAIGSNPGSSFGTTLGSQAILMHLDGANQLLYYLAPGNNVAIEWHTAGPTTGGSFNFHLVKMYQTLGSNDQMNWVPCASGITSDTVYPVTLAKQVCQVSSVDSRAAYSDADTPPTDANTSPRALNFSANIFKGGVFVGNMGATNSQSDRSGCARTQIYPGLGANSMSSYAMVICSLVHAGAPSYATRDLPVGIYCPTATDPNLPGTSGAASVSNVTWPTKWVINPRNILGSPPDYSQDPVSTTTLLGPGSTNTGSAIGDYASFCLTAVYDQAYTTSAGLTQYTTLAVTPTTAGQAICLADYNEPNDVLNNTTLFHWLVSPNYPVAGLAFPYNDAQPRLWLVTAPGAN